MSVLHGAHDVGNEEASIRATDAQWLAAAKARDTEQAASFWSDDATILMPNSPPITVKEAIRAYVTESFKSPDFSIAWTTDKVVVAASGDMAYATGTDHIISRMKISLGKVSVTLISFVRDSDPLLSSRKTPFYSFRGRWLPVKLFSSRTIADGLIHP